MNELTQQEADYIMEYTGLAEAMEYSLVTTPVVFFVRNGDVLDFITMFNKELNTI